MLADVSLKATINQSSFIETTVEQGVLFLATYGVVRFVSNPILTSVPVLNTCLFSYIPPVNAAVFNCLMLSIMLYSNKFFNTQFDYPFNMMFQYSTALVGIKVVGIVFGVSLSWTHMVTVMSISLATVYIFNAIKASSLAKQ